MTTTLFDGDIKPTGLVAIASRAFPGSTEMLIRAESDLPEFWLAFGPSGSTSPLGYIKWVRRGDERSTTGIRLGVFELAGVLPAGSPVPHPVVSLSGVLWSRRELLEAISSGAISPAPNCRPNHNLH